MILDSFDSLDETEVSIGLTEVNDKLIKEDSSTLTDINNIEAVLYQMQNLNRKVEKIKEYKKKKIEAIQTEINTLEYRYDFLNKIIFNTLKHFNEQSFSFPGLATMYRKKSGFKWVVKDEEKVIEFLNQIENKECLKTVTDTVIDKKKLNKFLDTYSKNNDIPESIVKETVEESVSISFKTIEEKIIVPEKD